MTESFLHGVNVIEVTSGTRTIRTAKSSVIGLIGTAPFANYNAFPLNKPVLISGNLKEAVKLIEKEKIVQTTTAIIKEKVKKVVELIIKEKEDATKSVPEEKQKFAAVKAKLEEEKEKIVQAAELTADEKTNLIAEKVVQEIERIIKEKIKKAAELIIQEKEDDIGNNEAEKQKFAVEKIKLEAEKERVVQATELTQREANFSTGTLPSAISAIFDQVGATVVVIRVAESENSDLKLKESEDIQNIIGGVDAATGEYKGIKAFLSSESTVHVTPRILIAPNFTHQLPGSDSRNPVIAGLIGIAEKLRAIIVADGPNTNDEEAIKWRKSVGSPRVYVVDPWVKVCNDKEEAAPASPFVAGLIAKVDNEHGFWWSPSNQEINGIVGTAKPVDFTLGDANCRANHLNENEIATIIHQKGYRLWGNRTCSSDPKWAFLSVRRTADLINDSLLRAHLWAVDRNITRTYLDDVIEGVNAYLAHLKAVGAILGGKCYANPELNTQASIADGKVYFDFDFTPPYPAEQITFRSHLINDYIKELI